jgi:excisionase family DNA binding protein
MFTSFIFLLIHNNSMRSVPMEDYMNQQFITVKELAAIIRLAPSSIYVLVTQNCIPHYKIGGRVFFKVDEIERWLATQSKGPTV